MKKIIFLILVLLLVSCKQSLNDSTKIEEFQQKCISEKLDLDINLDNEFKKIESYLLKTKLLDNISKESYINLFQEINSSSISNDLNNRINDFYKEIRTSIKESSVLIFTPTVIDIFNCNKEFVNNKLKAEENQKLLKYNNVLDELLENGGFDNIDTIEKLINSIPEREFSDINYRITIISLYSLISESHFKK